MLDPSWTCDGNLRARRAVSDNALEEAAATLAPLAHDAATAPLGHAALGDAYLTAATLRGAVVPFAARDRACGAATDVYVYAVEQALGEQDLRAGFICNAVAVVPGCGGRVPWLGELPSVLRDSRERFVPRPAESIELNPLLDGVSLGDESRTLVYRVADSVNGTSRG